LVYEQIDPRAMPEAHRAVAAVGRAGAKVLAPLNKAGPRRILISQERFCREGSMRRRPDAARIGERAGRRPAGPLQGRLQDQGTVT
jgi:hypothetical protein